MENVFNYLGEAVIKQQNSSRHYQNKLNGSLADVLCAEVFCLTDARTLFERPHSENKTLSLSEDLTESTLKLKDDLDTFFKQRPYPFRFKHFHNLLIHLKVVCDLVGKYFLLLAILIPKHL